jgi:hypothetical protein
LVDWSIGRLVGLAGVAGRAGPRPGTIKFNFDFATRYVDA